MTIADLRRQLQPGATYVATWLDSWGDPLYTNKRRVVSQSAGLMQSEVLDGPLTGRKMRLEWTGVKATEEGGVITLHDKTDFLQLTIEG